MRPARAHWTLLEATIIGAALLAIVASAARASEFDEFTRSDRLQHEAAGFVIGFGSALVIDTLPATRDLPKWERTALALVPVILAAAGKEAYDHQHPDRHDCDFRDAAATVLGGSVGVTLTFRF